MEENWHNLACPSQYFWHFLAMIAVVPAQYDRVNIFFSFSYSHRGWVHGQFSADASFEKLPIPALLILTVLPIASLYYLCSRRRSCSHSRSSPNPHPCPARNQKSRIQSASLSPSLSPSPLWKTSFGVSSNWHKLFYFISFSLDGRIYSRGNRYAPMVFQRSQMTRCLN